MMTLSIERIISEINKSEINEDGISEKPDAFLIPMTIMTWKMNWK